MVNQKLSNAELAQWGNWQQHRDQDAGDYLVAKYLPLVDYVIQRFLISLPKTVDKDEVRSYAYEGLLDALDKFKPEKDWKFETYAAWRIKGAIIDGLRKSDWLPRSLRDKVKKIEKAYAELEQQKGESASDQEVSEYLGMTPAELNRAVSEAALSAMLSMDDEQANLEERMPRASIGSPERELSARLTKEALAKAVAALPEKEKLTVSLCYFEEMKLTEIAEILGLSVSRVSQLHSKAMLRLHAAVLSVHEHY
ncbi:FliA/WhiG family RNA polymerase sigma factor [Planococcus sp. MSAK28401]|uniref:FliA/WhiG family RNA polymerase sigma factor n=1 Tax=Planococcus alpniumensis TaxID=2708345 RepID=UPI001B8B5BF6|nr:FliA/WhiG family RNA polymerase sigma factor [Planococcus sp. MSAK28401]